MSTKGINVNTTYLIPFTTWSNFICRFNVQFSTLDLTHFVISDWNYGCSAKQNFTQWYACGY